MNKVSGFTILLVFAFQGLLWSQSKNLPTVFFLGDNQEDYDQIISKYNEPLLNVCAQDMNKAFNQWTSLLSSLETYAEKNNFDIKGVKMWVNVFWDANGTVKHFVFYPKPNSKNIDYEKMKIIVASFLEQYRGSTIAAKTAYSHYGTANFPIFARLVDKN